MMAAKRQSAFVTFGWCRTAYAFVHSLGRRGIAVHVGDASRLAMSRASRYCHSFSLLPRPYVEPRRYFQATCQALRRTGARVLLPTHEEAKLFVRWREELPPGTCVALPELPDYELAEDKERAIALAASVGCPVPRSRAVTDLAELAGIAGELGWPVIVKTRLGNSAKGVCLAHDPKELETRYRALIEQFRLPRPRWPFLQEFLPGEAVGVCMLFDRGEPRAVFGERYLRCKAPGRFGTSTFREAYQDGTVFGHATAVMRKLNWHGLVHLDFVADREGVLRLIEINPRPWGAIMLAVQAGVDFPYLAYQLAAGEPLSPPADRPRQIRCRWVLGDMIAALGLLKRRRLRDLAGMLRPARRCRHDDVVPGDLLPFFLQLADYSMKFLRWRSLNPTGEVIIA